MQYPNGYVFPLNFLTSVRPMGSRIFKIRFPAAMLARTERPNPLVGEVQVIAEELDRLQTDVAVAAHEAQEIPARDEHQFARQGGFGGDLVRLAHQAGAEAEHFAGSGDFEDQGFAVVTNQREFGLPGAKQVDAFGRPSLPEEHSTGGLVRDFFDIGQFLQHVCRQMAIKPIGAVVAG